jgi:hypothetical protein
MSSRVALLPAVLAVSLLIAACGGEPPNKEIQQARTAIENARGADAARWAAEELTAAEDALKRADEAVNARDHRLALNHALDSLERAQNAARDAETNKAAARTQAERAIATAATALEEAQAKLKAAETARVPAPRLTDSRMSITAAENRVQEARSAFERGDWQAAAASTASALQALTDANTSLDAVVPAPRRQR